MYITAMKNSIATKNFSLFYDLELILGLHAIHPFLYYMHALIKLVKSHHVFMCDFIDLAKVC